MPKSREHWKNVFLGSVLTRGMSAEQIDAAVDLCVETDAAGAPCGTWHASAVVNGHLDRCPCTPCRHARGDIAPLFGRRYGPR